MDQHLALIDPFTSFEDLGSADGAQGMVKIVRALREQVKRQGGFNVAKEQAGNLKELRGIGVVASVREHEYR